MEYLAGLAGSSNKDSVVNFQGEHKHRFMYFLGFFASTERTLTMTVSETPSREIFFDNLLFRINLIIESIWWTGLAR